MVLACEGREESESAGGRHAKRDTILHHPIAVKHKILASRISVGWRGSFFKISRLKKFLEELLDAILRMGVGFVDGQALSRGRREEPRIGGDEGEIEKTSRF